jgi:hypothetical protein
MIDLLLGHGQDPACTPDLLRAIEAYSAVIQRSAGGGDVHQVAAAEEAVRADPPAAFSFARSGAATLNAAGQAWRAGAFEVVSVGTLKSRAIAARAAAAGRQRRARLWVLDGASVATDIGALQAYAPVDTLFQVASQFNCLEAGGPWVKPVKSYLTDDTQGPRASISAFPGTLLRHYAAPGAHGGERFVQTNNGRQIELLSRVCGAGVATAQNGYLLADNIANPRKFLSALESRFDEISVGVHDDVEVALGYDWDGAVAGPPPPRIGQVFTSTLAGGAYGRVSGTFASTCRQLLRAAYLGTLLAATTLGRPRVVLTLIGGGVFGNPIRLIWEGILWALDQIDSLAAQDMEVLINGRNLCSQIEQREILNAVRARGGILLTWPRSGAPVIHR